MLKGRGRDTRTVTPPSPGHLAARPPAIITKAPSQVQRRPRPEPDYEVVEFPSEQYVNAKLQPPPPPPPRPSAGHPADAGASCGLCGGGGARVRCSECGRRALCASCDDMYHRHPKRRHHQRQALTPSQLRDERPPLPPKSTPPVPPPRRHKLTGDRSSASPRPPALDQRRATLGHLSTTPHTPSAQALNHNNHSQRHPIPPHLQGKLPPASPTHLGSMPYLPAMQHAVAPVAQAPQMQSNTMGHLAAWGRQRGSLQGFHVPPNMVMPTEPWESPESVPAQSPPWARPMRRGASVLDLGAGCAGCAGPWRYGSCASLDHQWAWGAPCCLPPHPPPQHLHPHAHMHTPQAYRRADSRAASRVGSRAGSRAASPAVSLRSRASRRNKHRSPSPPPLPSSDADSESDSDSDNHVPLKHDRIRDLKQGPRRDERSGDLKDHRRDERSIDLKDHRRDERSVDLKDHRRDERSGDLKDHRRDERSVDLKDHRREERRSDVDVKYDHSKEDGSGESREKEEDTLGPAPPPPSASWQCEHCTFVNEPGVRVCAVCCRTPTTAPMVLADVCARMARVSLASEPSPARVGEDSRTKQNGEASRQRPVKERASTGCGPSPPREDKSMKPINRLVTPTREPDQTRTESRMRHDMGVGPSPPRDSQGIRNTMAVGPSSPPRDNHENHSMGVCLPPIRDNHEKHSMGIGPSPPRDDHERHSMGVGPSPPKEITVRSSPYRESKTPQRHSVSVGPSPPRDGTLRPATNNQIIVHKTTGTSPPRETLVESRSSTSNRANVSNTGTSPPPQSISTQTYDVPNSWEREPSASRSRPRRRFRDESRRERSHSRHSLSSDTRESERSVRTSGGGGGSGRWEWRGARDSSPCDWSEGERRRASSRLTRRASHLDLRRPHRRTSCYPDQAASPELLSSSRTLSLEALAGGSAGARREAERGLELAQLMTDAERLGFSAAEVHAALAQSPAAPLAWLRARWASLCAGVRAAAARLAPAAPVTELEARAALARHRGAMWPAVTDCVERHRRQTEVVSVGPEGRLRGRVWGSPGGADDDAAPPARRQPRAEDSSDEFEAPTPTKYRDDDWMYLPLEPPVDPSPDVWSEPRYEAKDDRTEDIAQRLKSFLVQAGVPTIDENLLLKGLLADNAVFKAGRENGDFNDKFRSNKPQSVDLVQSEIDFIDAYNALTRLSPLPNINNAMADALAAREINQSLNFTQERHNDLQKIVDISNPFLETNNKQINSVNGSLLQTVQNGQQDSEIIPDTIINEVHAELNTPKLQQSIIKRDYPPNANTVGTDLNLVSQNWNNANSEPVFVTLYNPLNNDARFVTETQLVISQNTITPKFVSNTQAERKDLTVVESQGDSSNNRVPADVQNMPKSQLAKRNTKKAGNHDVLSSNNTSPEPTLQKSVHKPRANSFKNSTKTSPKLENSKQEEEKSNNLSDIVDNTQKLIQQMKAEINSDINSLDGRSMSQSETENSSNESDLSTEHESSYSDTEEETDDLTSEANETTGTEEENNNHSEKSGTIINRTSSEENEQFEEAMDHIEEQNKSFKETNIEILDSIARSLQEEHTISLEINNTTEVNNHVTKANIHITESERSRTPELRLKTQQDFNNNSFAAVNSFEEIYDQLNSNNSKDTANELNSKQTKSQNFKENTAKSQTPKITLEKQDILVKLFKPNSPTRLLIVDKYKPVLNAVVDEIIEEPLTIIHHSDENNHVVEESVIVATFVENSYIDGNTEVPIVIKNSTTEDNGIYQDLHANSKLDTNINYVHDSTVENQIIQGEDVNATHSDIPRNSESPLIGNSEHIIVDTPLSNRIDISSNTNLDKNENNAKAKSKSPEKYNSIIKSNIPKLIKVLPNNKQKGEKTPPKVIASKVPVRRSSLKQYPAPDPPKSHFGNIQSGHVKQLQTRLFNSKTAKAQSPPTTVEATATTSSTLNKKRHAPLPPPKLENKQPSPPKVSPPKEKKSQYFRETCRTEDEWTESDSEDARLQIGKSSEEEPQRAPSPPPPITLRRVSGQLIDLARVRLLEGSPERQARMLLADGAIENWEQAQLAVELVSRGADPPAALLAALECADLTGALAYLHQDCELCASRVPEHEMVSMLRCTHRCCRECARHYFTVQITERSIADCVCPYCKEPELETLSEDEWLEYFAHLDILLKTLLDIGLHELFQRKLRDRTLARDPNFRWCVECSSGFFVHPKHKKLRCPECKSVSCATCRKPWSSNHEGLSCEQYATWLEDNDPERSLAAVQQHLRENGLECPRCHFKYSLSRGGCMHFTCTQCKYEFCYGCGKPFMMGARCGLSEYCNKLGLHAHHPRNCLFYLRDKEPHELQTLLQMNNVTFETEAADGSTNRCPVLLQRETPTGLVDGACGGDVPPKHAGLCKPHYVEYLAGLARALDPIPIMEVSELVAELRRRALPLPERGPWDTDPIYAGMCAEIVKEKIPLD